MFPESGMIVGAVSYAGESRLWRYSPSLQMEVIEVLNLTKVGSDPGRKPESRPTRVGTLPLRGEEFLRRLHSIVTKPRSDTCLSQVRKALIMSANELREALYKLCCFNVNWECNLWISFDVSSCPWKRISTHQQGIPERIVRPTLYITSIS